jgi:hypothetical protein
MQNKVIVFTVSLFVFCSTLFAKQKENRAVIEGLRPISMGGAFTAISDDENAFFYNPAAITQRNDYLLQILSIDVAITNTTIPVISDLNRLFEIFYSDSVLNSGYLSDQDSKAVVELINSMLYSKPAVFASIPNIAFITSPIPVEDKYLSFGLGFFTYARGSVKFNHWTIPTLSCGVELTSTGILPVAFKINSLEAIEMPGSLSVGVNFKHMYRFKLVADNISPAEMMISSNSETSSDRMLDYKPVILDGTSFGIDFGAIYHLNPSLNFGINIADIYNSEINYKASKLLNLFELSEFFEPSPISNYTAQIKSECNIGVSYYPEKIYYWPGKYWDTNNRLVFAFDLTDIANFDKPFSKMLPKKIHIGAEYKYDPFVIRADFNSGYPTIGCAIGTNVVQFEYAFYGQEQGIQAGQSPEWFHRIKLSIKLGHRKGKLYGKKRKAPISRLQKANEKYEEKLKREAVAKAVQRLKEENKKRQEKPKKKAVANVNNVNAKPKKKMENKKK